MCWIESIEQTLWLHVIDKATSYELAWGFSIPACITDWLGSYCFAGHAKSAIKAIIIE